MTEITDDNVEELRTRIEGQRIVKFEREPDLTGVDWPQGENSITIALEDGTELSMSGWGYDSFGLDAEISEPDTGG